MTMPKPPEPRVPYHQMSEADRRAAWASLRARQRAQARRHGRAPVVLGTLTLTSFVAGLVAAHYHAPYAGLMLWLGVGFLGFTVIALVRNLMGGIATRKDDLLPPGFG